MWHGGPPSWAAIDDSEMGLGLVVPGPVVLAGDVEPDLDLLVRLALPPCGGVYGDGIAHRLVPADDRPEIRRDGDPGHVLCSLDDLVADLNVGCPVGLFAPVVLQRACRLVRGRASLGAQLVGVEAQAGFGFVRWW